MKTYKILINFETVGNRKFAAGDALAEAELNAEEIASALEMGLIAAVLPENFEENKGGEN